MSELLHDLVLENIHKYADHIAILDDKRSITYNEIHQSAVKYAAILSSLAVEKGERIGIFSDKSAESIIAMLAILKAGAVFVPINHLLAEEDLAYIIKDCQIRIIFADDSIHKLTIFKEKIPGLSTVILINHQSEYYDARYSFIDSEQWNGSALKSQPTIHAVAADLAYIYYTSGSTGVPKGVMISHESIVFVVTYRRSFLEFSSKSVTLSLCALYFDPVINEIFCTLSVGGKLVLINSPNSIVMFKNFQKIIQKEAITIFFCVPSFLNMLRARVSKVAGDLKDLKYIVFGAGMCSPQLIQYLSSELPGVNFVHGYGLTETSVTACSYRITDPWAVDYESYPIGNPIENTEFYVVDEEGKLTSGVGELVIRGPHLMKGYWGKPEETGQVLKQNPFLRDSDEKVLFTGDLVRAEKNGELIFVGRKDEQIKVAGHRIELGEVEMRIGRCDGVKEVCVIALPDKDNGCQTHGYLVLDENTTLEKVKEYCDQNLLKYMIPQMFYVVPELIKNANGKIDKKAIKRIKEKEQKYEAEIARSGSL